MSNNNKYLTQETYEIQSFLIYLYTRVEKKGVLRYKIYKGRVVTGTRWRVQPTNGLLTNRFFEPYSSFFSLYLNVLLCTSHLALLIRDEGVGV